MKYQEIVKIIESDGFKSDSVEATALISMQLKPEL